MFLMIITRKGILMPSVAFASAGQETKVVDTCAARARRGAARVSEGFAPQKRAPHSGRAASRAAAGPAGRDARWCP